MVFDRIVCVLVTFYQWGHFVMLIIRNLNLISFQSWTCLESCSVASYPGGQDDAILPARDFTLYPGKKKDFFHIMNHLLTKFDPSRWLDIGLVPFCAFMDLDSVSIHKHTQKKLGQYSAILTSHLANNLYIYLLKPAVRC